MVKMSAKLANAFIRNVRARMQALGMNQNELAEQLNVGKSYVSQMLSGHRRPGLDSLESFANALGVRPEELIREKNMARTA